MEKERYNHLNTYLKNKFGEKTLKICIDGGFTCPNRDGKISKGGCIFCSEKGSGEHIGKFNSSQSLKQLASIYKSESTVNTNCSLNSTLDGIRSQVINYFNSYKAERANKFIAYFQNFTNTYDSIENLKAKYDASLIDNRIVALAVATRPDCITEDICKLLSSYKEKVDVWVELGLQTSNDETGEIINRGYTASDFTKAVTILNKYNIEIVTHLMVGLPNESFDNIKNTIKFINAHNIQGIKIHSTYIVKNTLLEEMYKYGFYRPITLDYYIKAASYILTHINPNIIIHKLSGDSPKDLLVAPEWNKHKKWIINGIDKFLRENNLWQGKFFI